MSISAAMSLVEIAEKCCREAGQWLSIAKVSEAKSRADGFTYGGHARAMAEGWALHAALLYEGALDVY